MRDAERVSDLRDLSLIGDKGYDSHLALAAWALERINFIDALEAT